MTDDTDRLVRRLADESDLMDLIHRYAFGLDHEDWELWRSVFADEVTMDMSDYQPEPPPRRAPADLVVANARVLFAGLERSQHFLGSHRFAIDGDTATITAHMRAEHWLHTGQGSDRYTMFGTYVDDAVRTDDGWKLVKVRLRLLREAGNRHLMREAVRRGKRLIAGGDGA
jgi:3-phenylpropionate/cinnamic acid dioxygenase small subunit